MDGTMNIKKDMIHPGGQRTRQDFLGGVGGCCFDYLYNFPLKHISFWE